MITVEQLVAKLEAETGFVVKIGQEKQKNLGSIMDPITVYVGYVRIFSEDVSALQGGTYLRQTMQDLRQMFDVQIVCNVSEFKSAWVACYKALQTWNPDTAEANRSGFYYVEGGELALANSRFWWVDRWATQFPALPGRALL